MEKITRFIKKERRSDFVQIFPFTTYSLIFDDQFKADNPKLALLFLYLERMFLDGIPQRDKSASKMPELMIGTRELFNHEFSKMAKLADYRGAGNRQHAIVENYFMENHPDAIAIEFPLFNDEMTAFGDILLATESPFQITVLDFKPNAHKERTAATQLYHIRELLSEMSGIDRSKIECLYFDELSCFEVLFDGKKSDGKHKKGEY